MIAEEPFRALLRLACGSGEAADRALGSARAGVLARARRVRSGLVALARGGAPLLLQGEGLAADRGRLRFRSREARAELLRSLLAGAPCLALACEGSAAEALARLCRRMGLDESDELEALRTTNEAFVAFGTRAGRAAVAHLATTPSAARALADHERALAELAEDGSGAELGALVAQALHAQLSEGEALLVQTRLPGSTPECGALGARELERLLELGLEPLARLHARGERWPAGPDARRVEADFPLLLAAYAPWADALRPAIAALARWEGRSALPCVRVHGDCWIGNLLFDSLGTAAPRLTGIVDWDRSRSRGMAGLDALQLGVTSIAEWRGVALGEALAGVWDASRRQALLARHLARIERTLGLDARALEMIAIALWLGMLLDRVREEGAADEDWAARMIEEPARALRKRFEAERSGGGAGP